jgi:hypothetical protein
MLSQKFQNGWVTYTSLRELLITEWKELSDLQESMRHLTSLEELSL